MPHERILRVVGAHATIAGTWIWADRVVAKPLRIEMSELACLDTSNIRRARP